MNKKVLTRSNIKEYSDDKIYLDQEFNKFWQKIENGENFAFMRNADGERSIMLGKAVSAQEGNWKSPNYISKLGKDIYHSLMLNEENVYYALSCPCCDQPAYYWYLSRIRTKNVTFANLWINANYPKFKEKFPQIKRDAILIANYRAKNHKIGNLNILKHFEIDDDCISFWENQAPQMIENIKKEFGNRTDLLYVVSAGPMSGPIIYELYKNNPNNCYIDFGSAIDIYYRENISRPYMKKGNIYAERNCWIYNPSKINFDVSVVLNLYKRPKNLELQLNALEKQTLKPKEILLYQDGTSDTIKIPEEIKNKFDYIEISQENKGCWERFNFAKRNAKSKYVCVLDDDTIPAERWLENNMNCMLKQEGLYGAVGILTKKQKYKAATSVQVGWMNPTSEIAKVDFVGHSWFFKKEWLDYFLEGTEKLQKLKVCGEDMMFSCQLKKHGIETFVPPQNKLELLGSTKGVELGNDENSLFLNNGFDKMTQTFDMLIKDYGFKTVEQTDKKAFKKYTQISFLNRLFSIKKSIDKKHIVLHILGIKFSFKMNN